MASSQVEQIICIPPSVPADWSSVVLPIDKPKGITSFDVIRTLRRLIGVRKIGHAGTLDPMATGLLICLIGRATKRMNEFVEQQKVYTGTIRLGQTTPSFDADTEVDCTRDTSDVTESMIDRARQSFLGTIIQKTPMYSAVKLGGERLYKKARRGEKVRTPPRVVTIDSFVLDPLQGSDLNFELRCSLGTYVRSIAHDLGQMLGVGGHLISLRRTCIGELDVEDAWSLEMLTSAISGD